MKLKKIIIYTFAILAVIIALVLCSDFRIEKPQELVKELSFTAYEGYLLNTEITRYPVKAEVFNQNNSKINIGIAGQRNELHFGRLPVTAVSRKTIEFENKKNSYSKIYIKTYGDTADSMKAGKNTFIIEPETKRTIQIAFNASKTGNHSGELDIIAKIPKYRSINYIFSLMR